MEVGFARTNSGVATNKNNNSEVFWAFLGYIPDASRRNKPVVFTTSPHNQSHYFISPHKQLHDIKTGHITNHITSSHPASNFMTSKSPRKQLHDIKTGHITTMEQKARSQQRNGWGIAGTCGRPPFAQGAKTHTQTLRVIHQRRNRRAFQNFTNTLRIG